MPTVVTGLDEDTKAVAGSLGSKRISIKAGVFRKVVGGKEVAKVADRHMNVIFVKMAHNPSRMFYTQNYQEDVKISPDCWSTDSKSPDVEVKNPVAATCAQCPNSIKGSGKDGKGTACRLSWRTAVVLPDDPAGDVMQLVLPAASVFGKEENGLYPFRAYVQMLASNNVSAARVITKMQFDMDASSPKLLFSAFAPTPVDDLEVIREKSVSAEAINAVKLTVYQSDEEEAAKPTAKPTATIAPRTAEDEPTVRSSGKAAPTPPEEVSEVLKKWGSKKETK